ncbi:MAG: GNAT family N-acetyltransferase [Chloroflexi bacterium]|nr:GNAT family N-acetyltransferase [Chloroflexota bacterium]
MPGLRGATVRGVDPGDTAALETYVRIRNTVAPENTDSVEHVRWEVTTYPGEISHFLAEEADGTPVGTASTGRIWMRERGYERFWLGIWVVPDARSRGIGSALYAAISGVARAAGKTGFETGLSEAQTSGHRFLANRGFVEIDRDKMVRLDLAGLEPPEVGGPEGIRIESMAARPDLLTEVHAVAMDAFPDIPQDEPVHVGSLEDFAARDVDRVGIPKDAFFVALDDSSGEVAGYASLCYSAGSTTTAYHDMTAVRRAFRGRGIAGALKRATIAWAVEHGLEALDTGNDEHNAPMRAVNLGLGYRPLPDSIGLRGPLAPDET